MKFNLFPKILNKEILIRLILETIGTKILLLKKRLKFPEINFSDRALIFKDNNNDPRSLKKCVDCRLLC